ncbi:MAG: hypothetical protein WAO76_04105 [Georgfuchsia sp.]
MPKLKDRDAQLKKASLPYGELIPWMMQVEPNLILNKDGSLMACYALDGLDAADLRTDEGTQAAETLENALRVFDDRIILWWTVDRRRTTLYPGGEFPDGVSDFIDRQWAQQFTNGSQFANRHWLSVLYTEGGGIDNFMDRVSHFMHQGQATFGAILAATKSVFSMGSAFAYDQQKLAGDINRFEEMLSAFDQSVRGLSLRRLADDDLRLFLHDRCNPATAGQSVADPNITEYLDSYLPDNTLSVGTDTLLFDHNTPAFVAGATVKAWPNFTTPGLLDDLLRLPAELSVSMCFRYVDNLKAKAYIEGIRKHNLNSSKSLMTYLGEGLSGNPSSKVDEGQLAVAGDASDALLSMTTQRRFFGYYNMTVLTYGASVEESEEGMRLVTQVINNLGFLTLREKLHLLSAWAGTLPGQWEELVRWFFVSSSNLADLAPIRTIATGSAINAYLSEQTQRHCPALTALSTDWNVPFFFSFHQGDKAHTLVIGPTRAGKSVLMNFLIAQFRKYFPCRVFIFDKDYSCRIPALLMDGVHVDMSGVESVVKLNPLQLLADKNYWLWVAKWIELLLQGRGRPISAGDAERIWDAVEKTANLPPERWSLKYLTNFLTRELSDEMAEWVGNGPRARFFDNTEDNFSLSDLMCIEVGKLFEDALVAPLFLEYAFQRIRMNLDGTPTLIYVEECWYMLMYERFAARLDDWLRTLGKLNAFLVLTTQGLSEIAASNYFGTLIDNIPNRIFLPNRNAFAHEDLYVGKFGLHPEQVARIRDAVPKMDYYITTPTMARMANVSFPNEILACLRSDSRAQTVFLKHYQQRDQYENWREEYVQELIA